MYIVLFKHRWLSLTGWIIRIMTGSYYTHAAVMLGDQMMYDASETTGDVNFRGKLESYGNREIMVFKIAEDDKQIAKLLPNYLGRSYDWKGVLGWLWKANDRRDFYCFEFCWEIMVQAGVATGKLKQTDANDLIHELSGAAYIGPSPRLYGATS